MTNINRNYKDSLFRRLFCENEKENVLSLYNALNNSNYTNIDDLTITTLEDVIYMKMKNDVSFLIKDELFLIEHQSTINPNMPLRSFLYFSHLYENILNNEAKRKKIYSSTPVKIPTPKSIVLYNGSTKTQPIQKLKLSSLFEVEDKDHEFEWTVTMYNINTGNNNELLSRCETLDHYMYFINLVNKYKETMTLEDTINYAVQECIDKGILKKFLEKHKSEVFNMLLTEYDEQEAMEGIREETIKQGIKILAEFSFENDISFEKCLDSAIKKYPTINEDIVREIVQSVYKI